MPLLHFEAFKLQKISAFYVSHVETHAESIVYDYLPAIRRSSVFPSESRRLAGGPDRRS